MLYEIREKLDSHIEDFTSPSLERAVRNGYIGASIGYSILQAIELGTAHTIGGLERIVHPGDEEWRTDEFGRLYEYSEADLDFLGPMFSGAVRVPIGMVVIVGGSIISGAINGKRAANNFVRNSSNALRE